MIYTLDWLKQEGRRIQEEGINGQWMLADQLLIHIADVEELIKKLDL
jgi:hypothetical protein